MKNVCKSLIVLLLGMVLFCNVTTANSESGQVKPSVILYVLADRNLTVDLDADNIQSRNQLADWWEANLIDVLNGHNGYQAKLIKNRDEFASGPDTYLLVAKIVDYDPGSAAARFWIGFGAGHCSMKLHTEFFGTDSKQIFAIDDYSSSSINWKRVARKLNENILARIMVALEQDKS